MRRKFLPLIECPYCARGEVLIDPHAVREYMAATPEHLYVHEHPEQKVFRFHSEHGIDRPCPHLFCMFGSVELRKTNRRGGRIVGSLDFDFDHRLFWEEIKGNKTADYAYSDGVVCSPVDGVRVDAEYVRHYFGNSWRHGPGGTEADYYYASGKYVFVEDADKFVAALRAFAATYEQALREWTPKAKPSDRD